MTGIEAFAEAMAAEHGADMPEQSWVMASEALAAGEFDVAAIIVAEDAAGVTDEEIRQLVALSAGFAEPDRAVVETIANRLAS